MNQKLMLLLVVLNALVLLFAIFLIAAQLDIGFKRSTLDSMKAVIGEYMSAKPQGGLVAPIADQSRSSPVTQLRVGSEIQKQSAPSSAEPGQLASKNGMATEVLANPELVANGQDSTGELTVENGVAQKEFHNMGTDVGDNDFKRVFVSANQTFSMRSPSAAETADGQPASAIAGTQPQEIDGENAGIQAAAATEEAAATVTVRPGDTLFKISNRLYGDGYSFPKLLRANPHITDPNALEVGERLRLP